MKNPCQEVTVEFTYKRQHYEVTAEVTLLSPSRVGCWREWDGGDPPEAAEWEVDRFEVLDLHGALVDEAAVEGLHAAAVEAIEDYADRNEEEWTHPRPMTEWGRWT